MTDNDLLIVGRIKGPYGIKGWMHLHSYTQPASNIFNYDQWQLRQNNQWLPIKLEAHKEHVNEFVIKFHDIDDREAAALLKGREIAILKSALPPTDHDEFYWTDLIGCTVTDVSGKTLGIVDHLLETGSNDVIVIKDEDN